MSGAVVEEALLASTAALPGLEREGYWGLAELGVAGTWLADFRRPWGFYHLRERLQSIRAVVGWPLRSTSS